MARMQSAKPQTMIPTENRNPPSSPCSRPAETACTALDCGFLKLTYVKSIESITSHDIDIEVRLLLKVHQIKILPFYKQRFKPIRG